MKARELRDKTDTELIQQLKDLRAELYNLRTKKATAQLDKPHRFKEVKRDIARILTILNERGINL